MQHLSPECEPRGAGALVELLRGEVGVDDGLHAPARAVGEREAGAHAGREGARQRTKRPRQQAVLVAEVVRHEPRGDARAPRDLRQGGADVADFGETVDGDLDELRPADLFAFVPHGGAVARRGLCGGG
jgi:hypothetical protein